MEEKETKIVGGKFELAWGVPENATSHFLVFQFFLQISINSVCVRWLKQQQRELCGGTFSVPVICQGCIPW